jgi:hypothetical protein
MVATTWAVGVPLAAGILFLSLAAPHNPPIYLSALLTAAASLAAGALGARYQSNFSDLLLWNWVARLHAQRRLATGTRLLDFDELLHSDRLGELRPRHDLRILTKLASALERKDLYTLGHSRRVARQACRIAADLGLEERDVEELAEAAALHDVGKIRVPDAVLKKNGALTIEELATVQEHPEVGARLVSALGRSDLTAAVLHHHESWDGRGYPRGLGGEAIPLFARIIAVADAYDAMTSDRPYRRGLSHVRAMEIVKEQSGRQFDPRVVAAFERCQRRHIMVPAAIPLVLSGRRLLRTAFSTGSAAATPAATAVTATALLISSGLAVIPVPPTQPPPAMAVAEAEENAVESSNIAGPVGVKRPAQGRNQSLSRSFEGPKRAMKTSASSGKQESKLHSSAPGSTPASGSIPEKTVPSLELPDPEDAISVPPLPELAVPELPVPELPVPELPVLEDPAPLSSAPNGEKEDAEKVDGLRGPRKATPSRTGARTASGVSAGGGGRTSTAPGFNRNQP